MKWFRFYAEVLNDPKVLRLSDREFRTWMLMLCAAAMNEGCVPDADLPLLLSKSVAVLSPVVESLERQGLMERSGADWVPHNWTTRQFQSDASTERVKRFREREANVSRNVSETPQNRSETEAEQNRTENVVPVHRAFERSFGRLLSPTEIEGINALSEEHTRERIDYALREAAELNKRSVRYVQRICENQEANGDDHDSNTNGANRGKQTTGPDTESLASRVQHMVHEQSLLIGKRPDSA